MTNYKIIQCNRGHNLKRAITSNQIPKRINCVQCKNEDLNKIIKDHDGYLIAGEVKNEDSILKIKCNNNHVWETKFYNLKRNSWCPDCCSLKLEKICRLYFQEIFNVSFSKSKPDFLKQENGYKLELDGFNEKLKIAFEHQGANHFEIIKKFKMTQGDLNKVQLRDKIKFELCLKNNIKLFIIPELITRTKICDLKQIILEQSINFNIQHLGNFNVDIDFSKLNDKAINEFKDIAKTYGGQCLSNFYIDANHKLDFICKEGHCWSIPGNSIKNNKTWCMKCSGKEKLTIACMQNLAQLKNGECLSIEYKGIYNSLIWKCASGHIWPAKPHSIKNIGTWCPVCAGVAKLTIEDMQEIAKFRGGKCLSDEYKNLTENLIWQCSELHIWKATAGSIKNQETWCKECNKLTIKNMHELAAIYGGKCLSDTYKNSTSELKWECIRGHKFKKSQCDVKKQIKRINIFCIFCKKEDKLFNK